MLRSATTTTICSRRLLCTLERRLAGLQLLETTTRTVSCQRHYFSSPARQEDAPPAFPSNLYISPKSSFAPKKQRSKGAPVVPESDEEEEEEEEEEEAEEISAEDEGTQDEDEEEEDEDDYYDSEEDDEDAPLQFEPPQGNPVIPLPDRLHVPVYNFGSEELEEVGTIWLNPTIFGLDPIRVDFLKRAVDYHRAKKRGRRKAHTKRIKDIRGSGRKLRPQKGQGMARVGHKKVPHHRGGAKAHGPTNLTHYGHTKLNKKVRRKAVQHCLAAKLKQGDLMLVNQFHTLPTHKTKVLAHYLQPFGIHARHGTTGLLIDNYYPDENTDDDDEEEEAPPQATSYQGKPVNLVIASKNLFKIKVGSQLRDLNVYDMLKYEKLILTLDALNAIEARLKDD